MGTLKPCVTVTPNAHATASNFVKPKISWERAHKSVSDCILSMSIFVSSAPIKIFKVCNNFSVFRFFSEKMVDLTKGGTMQSNSVFAALSHCTFIFSRFAPVA